MADNLTQAPSIDRESMLPTARPTDSEAAETDTQAPTASTLSRAASVQSLARRESFIGSESSDQPGNSLQDSKENVNRALSLLTKYVDALGPGLSEMMEVVTKEDFSECFSNPARAEQSEALYDRLWEAAEKIDKARWTIRSNKKKDDPKPSLSSQCGAMMAWPPRSPPS